MTATRTPGTYVTPECREARNMDWLGGHAHCPGPYDVRQPSAAAPLEVLKCACSCHPKTSGDTS